MLKYRKIDTSCPEYQECERIWRDSFPVEERPDVEKFRSNADSNPLFTLLAISYVQEDAKAVGLMTWWNFGEFIYGEHFAVSSELRGNGMGSEAFREITSSFDKPFVFEVEVPSEDNPIALRRIRFYERCGMVLSDIPYFQPPYREGDAPTPMCLMASDASFPLEKAKEVIYRRVYGYCD